MTDSHGWTDERRRTHGQKMKQWWASLTDAQKAEHTAKSVGAAMAALTPTQRRKYASAAAKDKWSKQDPHEHGRVASETALQRRIDRLHEQFPELSDAECRRRAIAERDARLIRASAKALNSRKDK